MKMLLLYNTQATPTLKCDLRESYEHSRQTINVARFYSNVTIVLQKLKVRRLE